MHLTHLVFAAALSGVGACKARPVPPSSAGSPDTVPSGRIGFAITFPRAGDTLVEGRTYVLHWFAPDSFQINLGIAMGGKDKGLLLNDVPARPDSLVWTVPVGFVTGFGPASDDQIRMRLENARNPDQWTETGPFTVVGKLPDR